MTRSPLSDILVVDFSRVLAGPLATMMLGDLGADVVKIERPGLGDDTRSWGPPFGADGESSYFLAVNRNKRSVSLDLSTDEGRTAARELVEGADVVVENFRAGVMEGFGLGYSDLAEKNPALIYARISGFGSGPGADLPGYDFLVQAMSGFMDITGHPDGSPTKTGVAIVDVLTGLNTAIGILGALSERTGSGEGQYLEVSLMSSALAGLVNQASSYLTAGVVPGRLGNRHPSIAPYEPFDTATEPIVIAVGNDRQFRRLCVAVGCPEAAEDERWKDNPARVRNREDLHDLLTEALSTETRDHWIQQLRKAGIPCGPVNRIDQAFQVAEELGLEPIAVLRRDDGSEVATTANPIRLSRTPVTYRQPPPRLGERSGDPGDRA